MAKEEVVATIEFGLKERVLQFYFFHKRKVHSYIAFVLGFSVLIISYFTAGPGAEDAVQAKKAFENWKKEPLDQSLKAEMSKSLKKIDGLERAKESEIAQILISAGQVDSADLLARQSINGKGFGRKGVKRKKFARRMHPLRIQFAPNCFAPKASRQCSWRTFRVGRAQRSSRYA